MRWRCPICAGDLALLQGGARCPLGHQFDRARQGYINLLPVNHKGSREPGDGAEMIKARQAFLAAGHYQPLANRLVTIVCDEVRDRFRDSSRNTRPVNVLDCGCGEGYYTSALAAGLLGLDRPSRVTGLDISRMALRLASRQHAEIEFAVASNFHLPVQDDQIDVMIRIFAPGDFGEVRRVLGPQGIIIVVSPGPRHLYELKQGIYAEPRNHVAPTMPEGFDCLLEDTLQFPVVLQTREEIDALLTMTPFVWTARRETLSELDHLTQLTTQADFIIRCYQPMAV